MSPTPAPESESLELSDAGTQDPAKAQAGDEPKPAAGMDAWGIPVEQSRALGLTSPALTDLQRENLHANTYAGSHADSVPKDKPFVGAGTLLDVVGTPFTAVESLGRDVYGLADFLMFDQLPELSERRLLYEPRTGAGDLLGLGLEIAGPGKLLKPIKFLGIGTRAARLPGLAALTEFAGAGKAATFAGRSIEYYTHSAAMGRFAAGIVRGAPIDFILSEHGAGLSKMLRGMDSDTLKEVGSILDSTEGESELRRRLKGTLEGALLGGTLHVAVEWLVGRWRMRSRRVSGEKLRKQFVDDLGADIDEDGYLRSIQDDIDLQVADQAKAWDERYDAYAEEARLRGIDSRYSSVPKVSAGGSPDEIARRAADLVGESTANLERDRVERSLETTARETEQAADDAAKTVYEQPAMTTEEARAAARLGAASEKRIAKEAAEAEVAKIYETPVYSELEARRDAQVNAMLQSERDIITAEAEEAVVRADAADHAAMRVATPAAPDLGITGEAYQAVANDWRAAPAQRSKFRTRDGRLVDLAFESPVDNMIWAATAKNHELKEKALKDLKELGVKPSQINEIARQMRAEVNATASREARTGQLRRTAIPVKSSGVENTLRKQLGLFERPLDRAEGTTFLITDKTIADALKAGRSGADAFMEAAVASGASPRFAQFLRRIGDALFSDVTVARVEGEGGAYVGRATQAANDIILLGDNLARGNEVAAEEIAHKIYYTHLDDADRAANRAEWKARQEIGDVGYRYDNEFEYFAHNFVDEAVAGLRREMQAEVGGLSGFAASIRNAMIEVWQNVKGILGIDKTQQLARQFLRGKRANFMPGAPPLQRVHFAEPTPESVWKAIFGSDATLSPHEQEMKVRQGLDPVAAPYKLSDYQLRVQRLAKGMANTERMVGTKDALRLIRQVSWLALKEGDYDPGRVISKSEWTRSVLLELAAMVGNKNPDIFLRSIKGTPAEIMRKAGIWAHAMQSLLIGEAEKVAQTQAEMFAKPAAARSLLDKADLVQRLEWVTELTKQVELARSEPGRLLNFDKMAPVLDEEGMAKVTELLNAKAPGAKQMKKLSPGEAAEVTAALSREIPVRGLAADTDAFNRWLAARGGEKGIDKILDAHQAAITMGKRDAQLVAAVRDIVGASKKPNGWDFVTSVYLKHILSGLRSSSSALLSGTGTLLVQPGRHWLGEAVMRELARVRGDKRAIAEYTRGMREAEATYGAFFDPDMVGEVFGAGRKSFAAGEGIHTSQDRLKYQSGGERFTPENFRTWLLQKQQLAPEAAKWAYDPDGPLAQSTLWLFHKNSSGQGLNYLENISKISSRPLIAGDEIVRQVISRTGLRGILKEEARRAFPSEPGKWGKYVTDRMAKLIDDEGRLLTRERIRLDGERIARGAGFTDDQTKAFVDQYIEREAANPETQKLLDISGFIEYRGHEASATLPMRPGSASALASEWINRHGWPRLFVPFLQSSTSLLRSFGQHFDFFSVFRAQALRRQGITFERFPQLANSERRIALELISENPRVRAEAAGRLATGALAAMFFSYVASREVAPGLPWVTGSLSSVKAIRERQTARGLQEFSIYIPGAGYISYKGIDPVHSVLGTVSEFVNYSKMHPDIHTDDLAQKGATLFTAFAHNLQSKSWLLGLTSLLEAFNDEDGSALLKVLSRTGTSLAIPNFVAQQGVALGGDDMLRQARTWLIDDAKKKLPYYNETLPPQRDILGEPIPRQKFIDGGFLLPFAQRDVNDDVIARELFKLGHGFPSINPRRKELGIDLRDVYDKNGRQAYDVLGENLSKTQLNGRTLRESLRSLFLSSRWRELTDEASVIPPGVTDPRITEVQVILERYRAAAYKQTETQFRELQDRRVQVHQAKLTIAAR